MKKYISEHLSKNFIWPSLSAAALPILLVRKLGKSLCFCIDSQTLNAIIIKNRHPVLLISKTLEKLLGTVRYVKLDVIYTFNQIKIKQSHEWLTAFNNRYGQFEYLVMLFGLCNVPEIFQSYINKFLCKYLNIFCTAYLDDILIYSMKKKDHASQVFYILKYLH